MLYIYYLSLDHLLLFLQFFAIYYYHSEIAAITYYYHLLLLSHPCHHGDRRVSTISMLSPTSILYMSENQPLLRYGELKTATSLLVRWSREATATFSYELNGNFRKKVLRAYVTPYER